MRNPDRVFLDVMSYAEEVIPSPQEFNSQSELVAYLERVDQKSSERTGGSRKLSQFALNEMVNSRMAQRAISGDLKIVRKELSRPVRSREIDESRSFNVRIKTDANFKKWKRNPAKMDLAGIDTKSHGLIKEYVKQRSEIYRFRGHKVFNDRNIHVFVIKKEKKVRVREKKLRVFVQDIITGRRVPKRVYSKFVREAKK